MNHANGLATLIYDTMTEAATVQLADHVAEHGSPVYSRLDNMASVAVASDAVFDTVGLESDLSPVASKGSNGTKIVLPKVFKRLFLRFSSGGTANFSNYTLDLFVPDGASSDADTYTNRLRVLISAGLTGQALNIAIAAPSPSGLLVNVPTSVNHGIQSDLFTVVVEKHGSIIKVFLEDAPDSPIEYDTANDPRIDITNTDIAVYSENVTDGKSYSVLAGLAVEY